MWRVSECWGGWATGVGQWPHSCASWHRFLKHQRRSQQPAWHKHSPVTLKQIAIAIAGLSYIVDIWHSKTLFLPHIPFWRLSSCRWLYVMSEPPLFSNLCVCVLSTYGSAGLLQKLLFDTLFFLSNWNILKGFYMIHWKVSTLPTESIFAYEIVQPHPKIYRVALYLKQSKKCYIMVSIWIIAVFWGFPFDVQTLVFCLVLPLKYKNTCCGFLYSVVAHILYTSKILIHFI